MKIRSFLAFELPSVIKKIVARVSEELGQSTLDVKWVKADNIHLTLVFMGNIQTEDLPAIGDGVREVCLTRGVLNASLKGIGCFPNKRHPRVVWLGLDGDLARMSRLRDSLQQKLTPFGIQEEKRRFTPHLTLGRFRRSKTIDSQGEKLLSRYQDLTSPVCALKELILFKSDLKRGGAEYTKLHAWPLSGEE